MAVGNARGNWTHIRVRRATKARLEAFLDALLKERENGFDRIEEDCRNTRPGLDSVIQELFYRLDDHKRRRKESAQRKKTANQAHHGQPPCA